MGNLEAKWFKASTLPDLLHKKLGGLSFVSGAGHGFFGMHSYPKAMQPPTMVGHGPAKPYVGPDSDLEVPWAQRRSTTLFCFGNCEVLATFRQKSLKQNK